MRILAILWLSFFTMTAFAQRKGGSSGTMDRSTTKGFFSVAAYYGMGMSRLLNTDSNWANYKVAGYGLDLDILIWDSGAGDIRLFGSHQKMMGSANAASSYEIANTETVVGIKFFTGKHFYLAGGLGNGSSNLTSPDASATLSYQMVKALLGLELQLSESWYAGLELGYRSAPVKKDGNPSLTENTYIEGATAGLRLIWSPPSVTFLSTYK